MTRTLRVSVTNVAGLFLAFVAQGLARGYHLSVDLTDGEMVFGYWLMLVAPLLTIATLVSAVLERRRAPRSELLTALALAILPAAASLLTWNALFGVTRRLREWTAA